MTAGTERAGSSGTHIQHMEHEMHDHRGDGRRTGAASAGTAPERTTFIHRKIIQPWLRRGLRRAAIAQLEGMPDYLLDDIGIERDHIPLVADSIVSGVSAARPRRWPTRARAQGRRRAA
jgi:uncharacterized protein YjiS (DUF1127 family)